MKRIFLSNLLPGVILVIMGLGLLFMPGLIRRNQASATAAPGSGITRSSAQILPTNTISGKPVELLIPSLNIDLKIVDGYYSTSAKAWTLTLDKAQFATITTQPNDQTGNTFIYGHNRKGVFNNLPKITQGAEAMVKTDNDHTFYYSFAAAKTTKPDDVSVFYYQGAPVLTLQTCTGMFFQNRELFTFSFEKVV